MKYILFLLISLSITINSYGQPKVRSMSDGEKRIFYNTIEEAEQRLYEYHQERGESFFSFPFEMFKDLILHDERSINYDFSFEYITEIYSDEKDIKIYSWNNGEGGAIRDYKYDGVFSYVIDNEYFTISPTYIESDDFIEEIDKEAYNNIIPLTFGVENIYTLKRDSDGVLFYINYLYKTYGYYQLLSAFRISNDGLISKANIFEKGSGDYDSTIEYWVLPGWNNYNNFISASGSEIIIPVTFQAKESEKYSAPYPSGRLNSYIFDGSHFRYNGAHFDREERIFSPLKNYSANVVTLDVSPWKIRIDLMPNGSYRYSSWKNRDISEQPDLVIDNGIRKSPIDGDKGMKSFKEEYLFHNSGYSYILNYEMVIYNGSYEILSPQLIVKRGEKVLMKVSAE